MINDPLINQITRNMYQSYLLSFTMDDIIDIEVLSFEEWVTERQSMFEINI